MVAKSTTTDIARVPSRTDTVTVTEPSSSSTVYDSGSKPILTPDWKKLGKGHIQRSVCVT